MALRLENDRIRMAVALLALHAACGPGGELLPDSGVADPGAPAAADAAPAGPVSFTSTQLCKLLSDHNVLDPTPNDVQHRANILGADLGIPVAYANTLYLLFGDTIGFAGIWGPGESHPDSVGYGTDPASAIAVQPDLLCTNLRFLALSPAQSIGPNANPTVVADFAGAAMAAPAGHTLDEYIRNPSGGNGTVFPHLPGDFEVPSGAFAAGHSIYVFYTTVGGPGDLDMKASYLAKWTQPSTGGIPAYQILYQVDERFDAAGPLKGDFINVAAEVVGDYVYLFGTGEYRKSAIHIARKRLDALATPGGFEVIGTVTTTPGYGEVSVRYFPSIQRWMVLAEELQPESNRIVAYFATAPEGPWGAPIVVHDMADVAFSSTYCCAAEDDCQEQQMFNCNRTGFYGTYLLPEVTRSGAAFTVTYTMSSFSPYNVALFSTTFSHAP